ncbi:MAG: PP2C family protein-serine/threonine phosphatase [Tepidisphaeraceae bacterium]
MKIGRRPWHEELAIIDRTMKGISGVTDPEELVTIYWTGISELLPNRHHMAVSRRGVEPPYYLVTRSSRFKEDFNPWTQRDRLPKLSGGLAGEIAYANAPVVIEDLPARLAPDDPAHFYLDGFQSLVALPQYDGGEGLNVLIALFPPGVELDHSLIPMLHWQAGLFGRGTQNLVLRNQLADALGALDRELRTVGEIQRSLLPQSLPAIAGFEMAAHYATSARAGGDYYDFFPLDQNGEVGGSWGLFIADVSGHGTPAAVLMAITHAIAHAQPGTHTPPARMLEHLNAQLARSYTRNGTFITAFYAVLDPARRTLTYSRAGHNPPRLVRGGRVLPLDHVGGLPLGIVDEHEQPYAQTTITLERSDLLLLYTDGITEAMTPRRSAGASRELFGVDRLDPLLCDCGTSDSTEQCIARIRAAVAAFSENAPLADDQTLIAIRCV